MKASVSVIVPLFNKIDYIDRCISSILGQSFTDFELIIIDDQSSDGSYEYLLQHPSAESFKLVRQPENQGVSATRNLGLTLAKSEYVAFLDADDYWHPDFLSTMHRIARMEDIDFLGCNYNYVKGDQQIPAFSLSKMKLISDYFSNAIRREIPFTSSSVLIKRAVIGELRFPDRLNHGEDQVFWASLVAHAQRSAVIPDSLAFYDTDVPGSLCKQYDPTRFPSYIVEMKPYRTRNLTFVLYSLKLLIRCYLYIFLSRDLKVKTKFKFGLDATKVFIDSVFSR
ncbi:glycosyltransferase family 2 protein [Ferrimonas balearica]|uniref:glycosyltransferase family 2 protein n=1 Tax=Ferrimonas balearica TaxID=44012 RepID=UPI001C58C677|nr:glycosyltransferase family 2 protein [Ferrimonas balearica]MBW3164254.1 glycosyltransferase family 2 protein [Ferrimonas balearica]MBY6225106.1 glycosyltransferase family 2 protein [Ferrimonas balearica]